MKSESLFCCSITNILVHYYQVCRLGGNIISRLSICQAKEQNDFIINQKRTDLKIFTSDYNYNVYCPYEKDFLQ